MKFNGENGYPNVLSYIIKSPIELGQPHLFKVRAAYQNGYTDFSAETSIYAC